MRFHKVVTVITFQQTPDYVIPLKIPSALCCLHYFLVLYTQIQLSVPTSSLTLSNYPFSLPSQHFSFFPKSNFVSLLLFPEYLVFLPTWQIPTQFQDLAQIESPLLKSSLSIPPLLTSKHFVDISIIITQPSLHPPIHPSICPFIQL